LFHVKHRELATVDVSRETLDRLEAYETLLLRWNSRINLIGKRDEAFVWQRHFVDSLQLLPHMPAAARHAIDLGSGGGFPGLVLAIASGVHFHLVESDQRKAAFLREAARETGAPATIHATRIEAAQIDPAPLVTSRALAPLTDLLALAHRFIAPGGFALFPKGQSADQELTGAAALWNMRIERFPSQSDPAGIILRLSEVTSV
jgi:16S rRNA (guanine527-N7)-methyltransferase